jgi:hypothetical protein
MNRSIKILFILSVMLSSSLSTAYAGGVSGDGQGGDETPREIRQERQYMPKGSSPDPSEPPTDDLRPYKVGEEQNI